MQYFLIIVATRYYMFFLAFSYYNFLAL